MLTRVPSNAKLSARDYAVALAVPVVATAIGSIIYAAHFAPLPDMRAQPVERFLISEPVLGGNSLEERARLFFTEYDVNGDGTVSHEEYIKIIEKVYPK